MVLSPCGRPPIGCELINDKEFRRKKEHYRKKQQKQFCIGRGDHPHYPCKYNDNTELCEIKKNSNPIRIFAVHNKQFVSTEKNNINVQQNISKKRKREQDHTNPNKRMKVNEVTKKRKRMDEEETSNKRIKMQEDKIKCHEIRSNPKIENRKAKISDVRRRCEQTGKCKMSKYNRCKSK